MQADIKQELLIQQKIEFVKTALSDMPGVVIMQSIPDLKVKYMSDPGLQQLGISLEDVQSLSLEEYHDRYFNPLDTADYVPKIQALLAQNTDERITIFQRVRTSKTGDWIWHMSTMYIFMRTPSGQPALLVTISSPIDPSQHVTSKISRLLEESELLRKNLHLLPKLSVREREVLKLIALGLSSPDIGKQLHISAATADTHRRNIRQKLDVNSSYELAEYARAFDLI